MGVIVLVKKVMDIMDVDMDVVSIVVVLAMLLISIVAEKAVVCSDEARITERLNGRFQNAAEMEGTAESIDGLGKKV
jgi:hypothetical protein